MADAIKTDFFFKKKYNLGMAITLYHTRSICFTPIVFYFIGKTKIYMVLQDTIQEKSSVYGENLAKWSLKSD